MITLILILLIVLCVFAKYKDNNSSLWEETWSIIFYISGFGAIFTFVAWFIILICLTSCRTINPKIEMLQEQNKQIEEKVAISVEQYMNYEKDTFTELKPESYINLVNLYPELKSDELIKQEIELYTTNNEKIVELKEMKIEETMYKWLIYFGK